MNLLDTFQTQWAASETIGGRLVAVLLVAGRLDPDFDALAVGRAALAAGDVDAIYQAMGESLLHALTVALARLDEADAERAAYLAAEMACELAQMPVAGHA